MPRNLADLRTMTLCGLFGDDELIGRMFDPNAFVITSDGTGGHGEASDNKRRRDHQYSGARFILHSVMISQLEIQRQTPAKSQCAGRLDSCASFKVS